MASSLLRCIVPFHPPVDNAIAVTANRPVSSLRLIASNRRLATRLLSNTTPKCSATFDESFQRTQMAGVPSMFFTIVTANMPGLVEMESDEGVCVSFNMPGVKKEAVNAGIVENNYLIIQCRTHEEIFTAGFNLPENLDRKGDYSNYELEDGMFKLTLPMVKSTEIFAYNIMDNLFDNTVKFYRLTFFCAMVDRSYEEGDLCKAVAHIMGKCKSFSVYKKESLESIYIKGIIPGVAKMEVTREGMCVSLNMPGLKIEDVESGFVEYDNLIIEGKIKSEYCFEHYIVGVLVPVGFHREDYMMKREMVDGMYKVTLPHVIVIKDEA